MPEGWDAIQRDLDKREKWACVKLMRYPGLHQKQHGQQVKGGDSAALLCSGESPPKVLHPALEPWAQERHGAVGVHPKESHTNDLRARAPVL